MKAKESLDFSFEGSRLRGLSGDSNMRSSFTKQSMDSAPAQFSTNFLTVPPAASGKKQNHGRRRASTSFPFGSQSREDNSGFPNAFSNDPFASNHGHADNLRKSTSSRKESRRSSIAGIGVAKSYSSDDVFRAFENDALSKPRAPRSSRRHSAHCAMPKPDTAPFDCDTSEGQGFANFDNFEASLSSSSQKMPHSFAELDFADFSGGNRIGPKNGESSQRSRPVTQRKQSKRSMKENPLYSIPDPMAELRRQQQAEQDFFANMPTPKGMDFESSLSASAAFNTSAAFSDELSTKGDFSDDETILWEEGGTIVSKDEKYNGNRSNGTLSSSGSMLNSSFGDTSSKRRGRGGGNAKPPRRTISNRKLDNRHGRGGEDDLTTSTPSTRISTDSEYSSIPSVELKTGSLLNDLVLIMDGKLELQDGKVREVSHRKARTSSRSVSSYDGPSRRRSSRADNGGDPFVFKQETRGVDMGSFSSLGSFSNERPRRGTRRTKSAEDAFKSSH